MSNVSDRMKKTIEDLQSKISSLRTNRANPEMLENIQVFYYGSTVPLKQLASINVPEPSQFLLNIFDQGAIKDIEKALMQSSLQLNPQVEGNTIRINLPELTQDRRLGLVKILKQTAEDSKVSIRNIRRDILDQIKNQEKNKEITEDESKKSHTEIQNTTDTFITQIDSLVKVKETEIMTL